MKSFKTHPAFQAYVHPSKDKILKYLELMYDIGSDLNKIDNLLDRKHTAATKAHLKIEEMTSIFDEKDEDFKNLRHVYLSEHIFHNKYQNLMTFQQLLWNIQRDAMNIGSGEEYLKTVDRSVDLMEKLESRCARLFAEIYQNNDIIDVAKENIRTSKSVEERLKKQS